MRQENTSIHAQENKSRYSDIFVFILVALFQKWPKAAFSKIKTKYQVVLILSTFSRLAAAGNQKKLASIKACVSFLASIHACNMMAQFDYHWSQCPRSLPGRVLQTLLLPYRNVLPVLWVANLTLGRVVKTHLAFNQNPYHFLSASAWSKLYPWHFPMFSNLQLRRLRRNVSIIPGHTRISISGCNKGFLNTKKQHKSSQQKEIVWNAIFWVKKNCTFLL